MRALCFLLAAAALCSGCDRRGSADQVTTAVSSRPTSAPPQPRPVLAPPVSEAATKYAAYKAHMQPLVDELNAVAVMIDKPATMTFAALDAQHKAIDGDEVRLIPTMPDVGSGLDSSLALTTAAVDVRKADVTWAELDRLRGLLAAGQTTMPDGSPMRPCVDMGEKYLAKYLAKTAVDVAAMNAAFKDGR